MPGLTNIVNGAPNVVFLGTDDQSRKLVLPQLEQIPQFLAKMFIMSSKGSLESTIVSGAALQALYGDDSTDVNSVYYTHQTEVAKKILETSTIMAQRVVMPDATAAHNVLCAVVTTGKEDIYKRDSKGTIIVDGAGVKQTDATHNMDTAKVSFIIKPDSDGSVITAGASKIYPLLRLDSYAVGVGYNNLGFSIAATKSENVTDKYLTEDGYLPFEFSLYTKEFSKAVKIKTLLGSNNLAFSFKKGAKHPYLGTQAYLSDTLIDGFYNLTNPRVELRPPELKEPTMYDANIEAFFTDLATIEQAAVTSVGDGPWDDGLNANPAIWYDYPTVTDLTTKYKYLINFISGKASTGVAYLAIRPDMAAYTPTGVEKAVNLSTNTPIFLEGGSDGTINNVNYEKAVSLELNKYADKYSEVLDMAYNVESTFIDSGFTLPTKKQFAKVLSLRPDTNIIYSTVDNTTDSKKEQTTDEMKAVADAITNNIKLYPESTYFNTGVMRAIIVGGNGEVINSPFNQRITQAYGLIEKIAGYMGADDGKWKSIGRFDNAPGNIISSMDKLAPANIPDVVKSSLFDSGIVWTQRYDRRLYHFPQVQTVYDDSTSVLKGALTMFAICTLEKIGAAAQREYTGSQRLSRAQLAEKVVAFVNNRVDGIFDDSFVIKPIVTFTDLDVARGYSWELNIEIGGNNMFTVETLRITAKRAEDV